MVKSKRKSKKNRNFEKFEIEVNSFKFYSSSLIFLFLKKEPLIKVSFLASEDCNERNA
jgi:hypothetical protein